MVAPSSLLGLYAALFSAFRQDLSDENDTRATINKAVEEVEGVAVAGDLDEVVVAALVVEITSEGVLMELIGRHKVGTPHCQHLPRRPALDQATSRHGTHTKTH